MYEAAFSAWVVAQQHIHTQWMYQTDPANLAAQVPRVMRDAAALVRDHGSFLGDLQDSLATRLNAPYALRIQREIRRELTMAGVSDRDRVLALRDLADLRGLTPPPAPPVLPVIDSNDIYLVCWTAITPVNPVVA